jgi:catechol 2,3-dioxygenase-like lactoylglutathione lyase family enzyme
MLRCSKARFCMITGLDRTTLLVRDLEAAVAAYRKVLAREPILLAADDGIESAIFPLDNTTLRLASPKGAGARGDAARAHLDQAGEGLVELAFRVDDIGKSHRRLKRLSLSPDEISDAAERDRVPGEPFVHKRTGISTTISNGLDISFRDASSRRSPAPKQDASIVGIDLIVVNTANAEHAMVLYGARLGLPLIFDRTNAQTGGRLLQFSCGDMVVEVVQRGTDTEQRPDRLWGIGWSVTKAEDTRERLAKAGLNVSDVKDGAKPGTRVFTIRDGTCNVPTLVVQALSRES